MDMEEKGTQVCDQTGDTAPDAGEQEDFEALIRGRYKEAFDARVRKILDGRLRGMVTDRDIVLRCVAAEDDPAQTMVRDIMTRSCAAVSPHADCRQAAQLMSRQQVRRLPVVEEGRLVGMLSLADLARSHRYDMEAAQALSEISENIVWGGK